MNLKNAEIERFSDFILDFELKGKDNRLRTRFVKLLMKRQEMIQQEHFELLKEYAELDENGELQKEKSSFSDQYIYKMRDKEEFQRQYFLLMNEEFFIEETKDREEMMKLIKEIILNCDKTFKGEEALIYDRWCDVAETIEFEG